MYVCVRECLNSTLCVNIFFTHYNSSQVRITFRASHPQTSQSEMRRNYYESITSERILNIADHHVEAKTITSTTPRACIGGTQSLRQALTPISSTPTRLSTMDNDSGYYSSISSSVKSSNLSEESELNTSLTINNMITSLLTESESSPSTRSDDSFDDQKNSFIDRDEQRDVKNGLLSKDALTNYILSTINTSELVNEEVIQNIIGNFGPMDCRQKSNEKHVMKQSNNYLDLFSRALDQQLRNNYLLESLISNESIGHGASQVQNAQVCNSNIEVAAKNYKNAAETFSNKAECIWTGTLPLRKYSMTSVSRKVFVGGIPWNIKDEVLLENFSQYGIVHLEWPQKDMSSLVSGRKMKPKGYCYLIFEQESSVHKLLYQCSSDPISGGDFYNIQDTLTVQSKHVQIIPWIQNDSLYRKTSTQKLETPYSVFIGALHGMMTAESLAKIFDDLFGDVVFASIDTDKFKYPIGSGRIMFGNQKSYLSAIRTNFVHVRTNTFKKVLQIDPYLEDNLCKVCSKAPGIYFCRSFECYNYYCNKCWLIRHNSNETNITSHRPLRRSQLIQRTNKLTTTTSINF